MARSANCQSPHRSPASPKRLAGETSEKKSKRKRKGGGKTSKDAESETEYEVERLLAKRIRKARVEYLIKWLGYPESESTWQSVDTMNCPDLIAAFEKEHPSSPGTRKIGTSPGKAIKGPLVQARPADTKGPLELDPQKPWAPGDWEEAVDSVDTVTRAESGQLHVWLLWKTGELSEELAEEANIRCPQKVIEFYQSRLKFPGDRH